MPEYTEIDHSISDHTVLELHLDRTTPQGTQFEGVLNGHEHRDISVRSVLGWLFGLFCFVMFVSLSLGGLFFGILRQEYASDTVPSATFKSPVVFAPLSREARLIENETADKHLPAPTDALTLMPSPHQPMLELRKQENHEVSSYGYVKDANGQTAGIHIPVDHAMAISLKKGFPVTATPSSLRPPAAVSPALEPAEDKGF